MRPMLNIAVRAVRTGGNFIIQNYDIRKFIQEDREKKKFFIKTILYKTNKIISDMIYKSYPNHIILPNNQYNLLHQNKNNNTIWIINELDGKNNFIKHFPHFCVSIAIFIKHINEVSVIYDPIKNDLFTAIKGQGSQLNGYRTRCSNVNNLHSTTAAIYFPNKNIDQKLLCCKIYQQLILCGISLRYTGSTVLDLAYVAAGKIDCLFYFNLHKDNYITGMLQAQESGCLINTFKESNNSHNYCVYIISSPQFIKLITEKIQKNHT
ncbi:inositol monophosphatase family protein [Buchnera aphidicola]|uniref:Inositol-1-monophosphatase n=1 Tax=Buchnera aphidicola subsp. Uroleucon sonchi TaxID=118118 RepID=A0A6C1F6B9_BUCUN|nr:inositol monophosphatase family protein [Buchnera aphidicola]QIE02001.1 inositol monophosphatase [Buchnera aphidicola (Uroleucon sonchi)]